MAVAGGGHHGQTIAAGAKQWTLVRTEGEAEPCRRERRECLYPSVAVVSAGFTAFGAAANSWFAIVLAVLGSSALGAIVRGYITT